MGNGLAVALLTLHLEEVHVLKSMFFLKFSTQIVEKTLLRKQKKYEQICWFGGSAGLSSLLEQH